LASPVYSIDFYAADPSRYPTITAAGYLTQYGAFPTAGRVDGTLAQYLPGSDPELRSLSPQKYNPNLGQIVVWDVVIGVDPRSSVQNSTITITLDWGTATTSRADYGFDYSATRGVIAAYVDASSSSSVDRGQAASVTGKSAPYTVLDSNGSRWLQGDITVGGLDAGDRVTLELWTVLRSNSSDTFTGVVQAKVAGAQAVGGSAISVGTQTIPLKVAAISSFEISGTSFEDRNGDGFYAASEAGLSGRTITLMDAIGRQSTTSTDENGAYAFTGLAAGIYTVTEAVQGDYIQTTPTGRSHTVTIGDDDIAGLDFGNLRPGSISGTVYDDVNSSSRIDSGDRRSGAVTVFIDTNGNGRFDAGERSTTTDSSGAYNFSSLTAGSYTLAEVLPSGVTQLLAPGVITLAYGATSVGNNFLNWMPGSIAGIIHGDVNGSGRIDFGDSTPAGITVFIDANGNGRLDANETSTTTNDRGAYTFAGLGAGNYALAEVLPAGATRVIAPNPVALTYGAASAGNDFLVRSLGVISGTAFIDMNQNGKVDAADAKLAGVTIFIDANRNGGFDLGETYTRTDASGAYSFTGLVAGSYALAQVMPGGAIQVLSPPVVLAYGESSPGNDFLNGVLGATTIYGSGQDESFRGTGSHDTIYGNGGNDLFEGGTGNDGLFGGNGNNTMLGGAGDDTAYGASGNDLINGGAGSDLMYGGGGADTIYGDDPRSPQIPGTIYDDLIEAGDGDDQIYGGLGNDEMQGEGGNDTISGGKDDGKLIYADPAHPRASSPALVVIGDNLYGNGGSDTFLYTKGDGVDLLWDFESDTDVLRITGYKIADMAASTFVTSVINEGRHNGYPLNAGTYQKLALILDTSGDAIIFNREGNQSETQKSVQFDDGSLSIADLYTLAVATPRSVPRTDLNDASAEISVASTWWGGFQGQIAITAKHDLVTWGVGFTSRYEITNFWGAKSAGAAAVRPEGLTYDLGDEGWNGQLAAGETAIIGFVAQTSVAGIVDAGVLLDGMWIA
jgi:Ca2+-binding RTX toxin-like protein